MGNFQGPEADIERAQQFKAAFVIEHLIAVLILILAHPGQKEGGQNPELGIVVYAVPGVVNAKKADGFSVFADRHGYEALDALRAEILPFKRGLSLQRIEVENDN